MKDFSDGRSQNKFSLKQPSLDFNSHSKPEPVSDAEAGVDPLSRALDAAEGEISKAEAILAAVVDGISIHDSNLIVQYQNRAHSDMFGRNIGRHCFSNFEKGNEVCIACPVVKSLADGKIHTAEIIVSIGGKSMDFEVSASPFRNQRGEIIGAVEVVRDITERKRAEEERARLAEAVKQAGEAIIVTDKNGLVLFANPAFLKITGYCENEVLGRRIDSLVNSGEQNAEFHGQFWRTLKSGKVWRGRIKNRRKDGSFFDADSTISPISDSSGTITSYVEVKRDITDQLVLQAKMQHVQKLESLGLLAGGIAHDFNNFLVAAMLNSDLVLKKLPPESKISPYIEKIQKAIKNAAELTNQMLAYSGKGEALMEPVELNRLILDLKGLLKTIISKKADFVVDLDPHLHTTIADASQMSQVIMNLIINASDALEGGAGKIVVKTGCLNADSQLLSQAYFGEDMPECRCVFLEVSDTGAGMSKETLSHIFDPFFTTKIAGRGLGLAAVLGIVKSHEGVLHVSSEPGQGTSFRILLKAAECEPETKSPIVQMLKKPCKGIKLLVVDDEESILEAAKSMLEDNGFMVLTAANGMQAVDLFRLSPDEISAVILDVSMPVMNGAETLRELRALKPDLKVIPSSGYSEKAAAKLFSPEDMAFFVKKPYMSSQLMRKIGDALKCFE